MDALVGKVKVLVDTYTWVSSHLLVVCMDVTMVLPIAQILYLMFGVMTFAFRVNMQLVGWLAIRAGVFVIPTILGMEDFYVVVPTVDYLFVVFANVHI